MKKIISILLATVLCLSLAACGGNAGSSNSEYDRLIEMLENGEYESAHSYIDSLKREEMEESKVEETIDCSVLYGEWKARNIYDEEDPIETISFKEDNTCQIGDKEYKWRVRSENETSLSINVSEGESVIYDVYATTSGREQSISLSEIIDESSGQSKSKGAYRKLDNYEEIEITADNFTEYFELVDVVTFHKDSFGDVSSMSFNQYVVLKEKYLDKISDLSNVVVELNFTYGKKAIAVDLASQTYTLGSEYELDTYDHNSIKGKFGIETENGVPISYRYTNSSCHYSESESVVRNYRTDMQVLRVEGSLYLIKE